jgi:predicted MFS family arabinose efflux permease
LAADDRREFDIGLTRPEWVLLLVLAAVQFTHSMDFMVLMPLGPQCEKELEISPQEFSLVVAAYGFAAAIAGLLAASFIDRFDRKTALLLLYGGFTAGTLLCAAAPGYWWLVLGRSIAGAFGGLSAAVILVIIGDAFPEMRRGRATGVVMTAFSLASIAGLPAGIVLGNRFGVRTPFAVLGVVAMVISVVAYRILPRLRGHLGQRRVSTAETWAVLAQPAHLRAYAFMALVVMGSFTIAPHFSDFLVYNVGRANNDLALVYLCGGLLTFGTLPLVGRLADRFGKRIIFWIMAACTVFILLALTNLPAMALAPLLIVTTLYWIATSGRWVPAMAMITSSALPRYRGSFMSVNSSVQQMTIGLAAVVAGQIVGKGPDGRLTGYASAGIIAAVCTGASMVLASHLRVPEEVPETSLAIDALDEAPRITAARIVEAMPLSNGEHVAKDRVG